MKKLLFAVGGIVLVLAVIGVVRRSDRLGSGPEGTSRPDTYTVIALAADVMVKHPSDAGFSTVAESAEIAAGAQIKTSASGKAKLLYPNGTVTLIEQDSMIEVTALEDSGDKSRITVMFGGIWSKVKNILGTSDYYEVETENVVASVRGTIFRAQFRNRVTNVYGIEHNVRVKARHPKTRDDIAGTDVDLSTGEKTTITSDSLPAGGKALLKRAMAAADFQQTSVRRHLADIIEKRDLEDRDVKTFIERIRQYNVQDKPFIQELIKRELISTIITSPAPTSATSPSKSPAPSPSATATPRETASILPTALVTSTPAPSPTPTPVIDTAPILESVFPKTITAGTQFTLNGSYFTTGRNTPQITAVTVGSTAASFWISDSLTIFVTADAYLAPGTYDVSATTSTGAKLTLPQALTIQ